MQTRDSHLGLNLSAGFASVAVALVLVGLKLWALASTGALSVAASLADNVMDLLVSSAGLGAILYAARPADDDHAFGHSSIEDIASLGQAVLVSVSAFVIAGAASLRLISANPPALAAEGEGIVVMLVSVVLTGALVLWQSRVAARTGNKVVAADRLHYLGDLFPTLGAILALWLSARFGWSQVDSVIAILAAAYMLRGAAGIGLDAFHALMDRSASPEVLAELAEIAANHPGVLGFHDLKTRTAGSKLFVNLHVELDGAQSLDAAHAIAAALKARMTEAFPRSEIIIHQDVWRG
ncbi:cation diffusion facilitator family transporter [Pseudothioclava arenosa]|uniref:Cation-efflux pump n=1 Tax=Pseudothioclava arenosa TaxID=1795308 RepID=A0A2A4CPB2_9RHOB|nr:cation diffusion facilitator family transporter [Pseudothioclava arenosa]PCD76150.1 cation-efflux pump [Pseudothioclava arenosa]